MSQVLSQNSGFRPLSVGELYHEFKMMRIDHQLHRGAVKMFEKLRLRKVGSPRSEQTAALLFAESQSGKSTTVRLYIEKEIIAECLRREIFTVSDGLTMEKMVEKQPLALYVKLSGNITMSKLLTDLLHALGDLTPSEGAIPSRKLRLFKLLNSQGVEIIFIDEAQHLKGSAFAGTSSKAEDATEVQNTLKNIITNGWPIVFVGTQEAAKVVFERQIGLRTEKPIEYGPLKVGNDGDELEFIKFCAILGGKLAEHEVLPFPANLLANDIAADLMIASGGRYGVACDIVLRAVEEAYELETFKLNREIFERVVEDFSLRNKVCSYNPFSREVKGDCVIVR